MRPLNEYIVCPVSELVEQISVHWKKLQAGGRVSAISPDYTVGAFGNSFIPNKNRPNPKTTRSQHQALTQYKA
jgi:hypothetical protein